MKREIGENKNLATKNSFFSPKNGENGGEKAYIPNKDLELTDSAEIVRLRKVIEEKNAVIQKFKHYDEERKSYYRRFEQNYAMMSERFDEFLEAVNACDELEESTKQFYCEVVMRLYKGKVADDVKKSALQITLAKLSEMEEGFGNLEWLMTNVGNAQKRSELLTELRRLKFKYNNAVSTFKKKMKELGGAT